MFDVGLISILTFNNKTIVFVDFLNEDASTVLINLSFLYLTTSGGHCQTIYRSKVLIFHDLFGAL